MFVVMSGSVNLSKSNDRTFESKILGETKYFGEKCLQEKVKIRQATAKAIEDTYCLSLNSFNFLDKTFFFEHN
jgi:CRP-like cAMP-binding protein